MRFSTLPDACSAAWLHSFGHYATAKDVADMVNNRLNRERDLAPGARRLSAILCLCLVRDDVLVRSLRANGFKRTGKYVSNYHGQREVALFMRPISTAEINNGEMLK